MKILDRLSLRMIKALCLATIFLILLTVGYVAAVLTRYLIGIEITPTPNPVHPIL